MHGKRNKEIAVWDSGRADVGMGKVCGECKKMKYVWKKHHVKCFNKGKIGMQRQGAGGQRGEDCRGIYCEHRIRKGKKMELEIEMIRLSFHQSLTHHNHCRKGAYM